MSWPLGFALCALSAIAAFGQSTDGNLSGRVVDQDGVAIAHAEIQLFECGRAESFASKMADDAGAFSFSCLKPRRCLDVAASADGMRPRPKFRANLGTYGDLPPIVINHLEPLTLPLTRTLTYPVTTEQKLNSLLRIHVGPALFLATAYSSSVVLWQRAGTSWTPSESFEYGYDRVDTFRYRGSTYIWIYDLDRHGYFSDGELHRINVNGKLTEIWRTWRTAEEVCCGGKEDLDADNGRKINRLLKPGDQISYEEMSFKDNDLRFEMGVCNPNQRADKEPCYNLNRGTERITGAYTIENVRLKITSIRRSLAPPLNTCASH